MAHVDPKPPSQSDLQVTSYNIQSEFVRDNPGSRRVHWWLWAQAFQNWRRALCNYAGHPDPLVETSNWVALTIGTHLPLWPIYLWWCAGAQCFPSAWLTSALTPLFLLIPLVSRRSGLAARIMTPVSGVANTVFVTWILGAASGTELFFVPSAVAAAMLFRRSERWLMVAVTFVPLIVWYYMFRHPPAPLHRYNATALEQLMILNAASIGVLIALFGWFHAGIYQRMEAAGGGKA